MFWVLLRLALHLSLREGRSVSGEEKARIVAVISNLARSIALLNVNGFLPGGLVSTLVVMLRFYLMGHSVCKLMPKVVLLKTFGIKGNSCKNDFDQGTQSLSGMSALIVIPMNIYH